ncbi:MAG: hypothetical protein WAM81_12220 [Acidimicrobiia bacterium]
MPRRASWIALVATTLLIMGSVVFIVGNATPPLRLISVVAVVATAGGLLAGFPWLVATAFGFAIVEIGLALTAGSMTPGWIPALAVGVFLAVEASVAALEVAGDVIAPREPVGRRLAVTVSTAAVVWTVASVIALIAGGAGLPGTFTRIAGVAAATAVLATLTRLVERRTS